MASESDSEVASAASINSQFYTLFTDDVIVDSLKRLGLQVNKAQEEARSEENVHVPEQSIADDDEQAEELASFFEEIGVLLPVLGEPEMYVPNSQSPVLRVMTDVPHIERIIGEPVNVAVLSGFLRRSYVPCYPMRYLSDQLPFETTDIEDAQEMLRKLDILRRGMVIDGNSARMNVFDESRDVLAAVKELRELVQEEGIETVDVAQLDAILESVNEPEKQDEEILVMSESEFFERVEQAANEGIDTVHGNREIDNLEEGDTGFRLNLESNAVITLGKAYKETVTSTATIPSFAE